MAAGTVNRPHGFGYVDVSNVILPSNAAQYRPLMDDGTRVDRLDPSGALLSIRPAYGATYGAYNPVTRNLFYLAMAGALAWGAYKVFAK